MMPPGMIPPGIIPSGIIPLGIIPPPVARDKKMASKNGLPPPRAPHVSCRSRVAGAPCCLEMPGPYVFGDSAFATAADRSRIVYGFWIKPYIPSSTISCALPSSP